MTLKEYLKVPPGTRAYYKDCLVIEVNTISPRYALVTVRIPLPVGGDREEIVAFDTELGETPPA